MPDTRKVAVVTGAGSGIGAAVTRSLLDAGHQVVLAGRRADALEQVAAGSPRALCVPTDVTDAQAVTALFERVEQRHGRVDLLMTNAGANLAPGPVHEVDADGFARTLTVNVTGTLLCAQAAARLMRRQTPRGGRILTNGSISAHVPRPGSIAYTTSKHAVTGLTRSIELDGRPDDIRATQLDIGNAATPMTARMADGVPQPDGRVVPEPTFDPAHVGALVRLLIDLPLDVSLPFLTVAAAGMPWIGRG